MVVTMELKSHQQPLKLIFPSEYALNGACLECVVFCTDLEIGSNVGLVLQGKKVSTVSTDLEIGSRA